MTSTTDTATPTTGLAKVLAAAKEHGYHVTRYVSSHTLVKPGKLTVWLDTNRRGAITWGRIGTADLPFSHDKAGQLVRQIESPL